MKLTTKAAIWQCILLFNLVFITGLWNASYAQKAPQEGFKAQKNTQEYFAEFHGTRHLSDGWIETESEEEEKLPSNSKPHTFLAAINPINQQVKTEIEEAILWQKSLWLIHHSHLFRHILNMNFRL